MSLRPSNSEGFQIRLATSGGVPPLALKRIQRLIAMIAAAAFSQFGVCASSRSSCRAQAEQAAWSLHYSLLLFLHSLSGRPSLMRFAFVSRFWQLTKRGIPFPLCRTATSPPQACTSSMDGLPAWWQRAPHWTRLPRKARPTRARRPWMYL